MTSDEFMGLVYLHIDEFGGTPGAVLMTMLETYYPSLHGQVQDTWLDTTYAGSINNPTFQALRRWLYENWSK